MYLFIKFPRIKIKSCDTEFKSHDNLRYKEISESTKGKKKKRRKRKPSNIGIVVSSSVRNNLNEDQINQCTDSHFYISNLLLCRKKTKQSKNNSTTVLL